MRALRRLALIFLSMLPPALAAGIGGSWKVTGMIGEFPIDIVCTLKQVDNKLTGSCRGMDIGELAVAGEVAGKTVNWSYTVNFQGQAIAVVYNAAVESDTAMKGNVSVTAGPAGSFSAAQQ
jgi:hypothetical protein